jgi:hypothetical protein
MIGLDAPILAKRKTDKSEHHQDGSSYHQPMWILHPGEQHHLDLRAFPTAPKIRGPVRRWKNIRISLRILNGRHVGRDLRVGRVKRDRQNESNGKTVGDNCNFGIAHLFDLPENMDQSAPLDLWQAHFRDLGANFV